MKRTEPRRPGKTPATADLKMKDLVAATGLPKSTILYYQQAGLLPASRKTSRNMAYYDPACVARLNFIKLMQSRHRLPLAVIKKLLQEQDQGWEMAPLLELRAAIFGRDEDLAPLDRENFCRATGLTVQQLEALEATGILLPLEPGRYDQEDLAVGRLLKEGLENGLTPQDGIFYPRLAAAIVDQEMALRRKLTLNLPVAQDAALTLQLTQIARALRTYVIDRVFQHRIMAMGNLKDQEGGPAQ